MRDKRALSARMMSRPAENADLAYPGKGQLRVFRLTAADFSRQILRRIAEVPAPGMPADSHKSPMNRLVSEGLGLVRRLQLSKSSFRLTSGFPHFTLPA